MQSKQKKVNWNRIFTAVDAITNGYNNLFEVLTDEWNKSDYANPLEFRKAFVEEYVKRKVTKDPHEARAYANRVACEAGFRIRGKGAGRKPESKSPAEARKAEIERALKQVRALKMNAKETKAFIVGLAKNH
jgi:hypothetical protein